jgi:lysyl-tRNA synthetase class 2
MTSKKWWRSDFFALRAENLKERVKIIKAIRDLFDKEDFLEVETPILQVSPGLEVHLQAFETKFFEPFNEDNTKTFYLHTSPEFAMKKLLAAGLPKIYQFAHVFRNGERSYRHHPEFIMLEWYRANHDYHILMQDCENILREALKVTGKTEFRHKNFRADLKNGIEILTVEEAFKKYCGFSILNTIDTPLNPTPEKLMPLAKKLDVNAQDGNTWEDLFFKIMGKYIEPNLGMGRPTILCEYPISMAALSRPKPNYPDVAERFEMFVCGIELANAFSEMKDTATQRARFEADMKMKETLYGLRYPIDEDFMQAMEEMPECTGIALGLDRLIMITLGADKIEDVLFLPVQE